MALCTQGPQASGQLCTGGVICLPHHAGGRPPSFVCGSFACVPKISPRHTHKHTHTHTCLFVSVSGSVFLFVSVSESISVVVCGFCGVICVVTCPVCVPFVHLVVLAGVASQGQCVRRGSVAFGVFVSAVFARPTVRTMSAEFIGPALPSVLLPEPAPSVPALAPEPVLPLLTDDAEDAPNNDSTPQQLPIPISSSPSLSPTALDSNEDEPLHAGPGLVAGAEVMSALTARADLGHVDMGPLAPSGQPEATGRLEATLATGFIASGRWGATLAAGGPVPKAGPSAIWQEESARDEAIYSDLDLWLLGGDDSRVNGSCSYLAQVQLRGPGRHGATRAAVAYERHVRPRVGRAEGDLPVIEQRATSPSSSRGRMFSRGPMTMSLGQACWEAVTGRSYSSSPLSLVVPAGVTLPLGRSGAGTRGQVLQHLRALLAAGVVIYVGITENPARRWAQHQGQNPMWSEMQILFIAETSRDTAAFERAVLADIGHGGGCQNIGPGGECASAGSPHYLYVVLNRSGLSRRGRR